MKILIFLKNYFKARGRLQFRLTWLYRKLQAGHLVFKVFTMRLFLLFITIMLAGACSSSKKASVPSGSAYPAKPPSRSIQKKFGTLMGVSPDKITNPALYEFIDKWLHTSYRYGSQSEKEIDCSGFAQKLYEAVYKKKLPRTSDAQYHAVTAIDSPTRLAEGDLVFFTTIKGKKISHVGIYLQNHKFVNATTKGVLISDMNLKYWKDSFAGAGRVE